MLAARFMPYWSGVIYAEKEKMKMSREESAREQERQLRKQQEKARLNTTVASPNPVTIHQEETIKNARCTK